MGSNRCTIRKSDDEQRDDEDWKRPRKPDSETVSYLREVEEELKRIEREGENQKHAQTSDDVVPTAMSLLIDNALAEIRYSTASLMCDKDSSMVLEQLIHASALNPNKTIALMLSRCESYFLCLAMNPFASHVLQTLLDLSGPAIMQEIKTSDMLSGSGIDGKGDERHAAAAESGTDEEHIPLIWEAVLSLAHCAKGNWLAMARSYSGSHVGRALIRVLTGCHMSRVDERGGYNQQFSLRHSAVDGIVGKWGEQSSTFPRLSVPECFKSTISELCEEISEWRPVDLQRLTCSTSGGPFLITTLAACASSSGVDGEHPLCLSQDAAAMKVIESALEWGKGKKISHGIVYGMAGEPVGSRFLEAVIWLAPLTFLEKLHLWCLSDELREYCIDGNANFVVQALLRRLANEESVNTSSTGVKVGVDEHEVHASSHLFEEGCPTIGSTLRAIHLAKSSLEELLWPTEGSSFESEFLSSVPSGVLCAVAELARRLLPDLQGSVRDAIGRISTGNRPSLLGHDQKGTLSSVNSEAFAEARSWLPKLLSPHVSKDGDSEPTNFAANGGIEGHYRPLPVNRRRSISVNVPGAQAIRSMLLFSRVNEAAPVAAAISVLPQEVLVAAAKDSTAGRCIIDPVLAMTENKLEGKKHQKAFRDAKLAIARSFKLHCFSVMPMDMKCNMANELCGIGGSVKNGAERVNALSNYAPSGMTVVQKLQLERYSRDKKGWKEAILRRGKQAEAFEVAFGGKGSATATKLRHHCDNELTATVGTVGETEKKARHRKNVDNEQSGATEGGDGDRVVCKKAKRSKKGQTAEIERETALDELLEGMGGRKTLLNDALLLRKDSTARKTTEGGGIIAAIGKPGRAHSTRHKRRAKAMDDKGGVKIQELPNRNDPDKHEGNNIDDSVDVKGSTSFSTTEVSSKNKRKKKSIHDSNGFRLFK